METHIKSETRYGPFNPKFAERVWAERRRREAEKPPVSAKLIAAIAEDRRVKEDRRRTILARVEKALEAYQRGDVVQIDRVPIRTILRAICDHHGVSIAKLQGRGRQRYMTIIRDEAIRAVADARPEMSLPELGRVFGNRDHTTILHSLRKTAKPGFDYRGRVVETDVSLPFVTIQHGRGE